jgi:hypothetical protein
MESWGQSVVYLHGFTSRGRTGHYIGLKWYRCPVFTTTLANPRINANGVTTSCGLYLTCRGEKYIH